MILKALGSKPGHPVAISLSYSAVGVNHHIFVFVMIIDFRGLK